MTKFLEMAFSKSSKLSAEEQVVLTGWSLKGDEPNPGGKACLLNRRTTSACWQRRRSLLKM